jgi:ABC-2 type transport system permease protein
MNSIVLCKKWRALFVIYFQEAIAYRASGFIWILTDIVTAVTMPLVWANASHGKPIAGFSTGDFVHYYLCLLMIQNLVQTHIMWDLSMEIKEGQFSAALVRPVSFFQVSFMRNASWRIMRAILFTPVFVTLLFAYRHMLGDTQLFYGWQFWTSVILGHCISFTFAMFLTTFALFVQEAQSIFELHYLPMMFLSGQLFPIGLMPNWVKAVGNFFPFYYTTGAPTEILIGKIPGSGSEQVLLIQMAWVFGLYVLYRIFVGQGLKHYTAVGM